MRSITPEKETGQGEFTRFIQLTNSSLLNPIRQSIEPEGHELWPAEVSTRSTDIPRSRGGTNSFTADVDSTQCEPGGGRRLCRSRPSRLGGRGPREALPHLGHRVSGHERGRQVHHALKRRGRSAELCERRESWLQMQTYDVSTQYVEWSRPYRDGASLCAYLDGHEDLGDVIDVASA